MLERRVLAADVVYNGIGTPRRGGAVALQGSGGSEQVVAVDDLAVVRRNFPEARVEHAGFAISPEPVNAHTHLDLSDMPQFVGSYDRFIAAVIAHKRQGRRGLAAAKRGVAELRAEGISTVGDIVHDEEVMRFLLQHPELSGVAYWEVIAVDRAKEDEVFDRTVRSLRRFRDWERPGGVRLGLAPHAPHTVGGPMLVRLAELAKASRLPMQIHVAESPAEVELHRHGTGPLRDMLAGLGSSWRPSGGSPLRYLERLGVLEARPSLVHMVHVDEDDVRAVQKAGCVVVHCARSNSSLGCGRFPWELYAKHGVEVAFGTDSRGSAPDLSIRAEVREASAVHGAHASPLALVRAAVKGGARALGMVPPQLRRGDAAERLYIWP